MFLHNSVTELKANNLKLYGSPKNVKVVFRKPSKELRVVKKDSQLQNNSFDDLVSAQQTIDKRDPQLVIQFPDLLVSGSILKQNIQGLKKNVYSSAE